MENEIEKHMENQMETQAKKLGGAYNGVICSIYSGYANLVENRMEQNMSNHMKLDKSSFTQR